MKQTIVVRISLVIGISITTLCVSKSRFENSMAFTNLPTSTHVGSDKTKVLKLYEGRPNVADMITNGEIDLIINSPVGKSSVNDDSYLRKAAIKAKVPYVTTVAAAKATADGIHYIKANAGSEPQSLQTYHSQIK